MRIKLTTYRQAVSELRAILSQNSLPVSCRLSLKLPFIKVFGLEKLFPFELPTTEHVLVGFLGRIAHLHIIRQHRYAALNSGPL